MPQFKQMSGKEMNPPSCAFCSGPYWFGGCPPTVGRAIYCANPQIQMLISSGTTLADTPRSDVSTGPVAQSSCIKLASRGYSDNMGMSIWF